MKYRAELFKITRNNDFYTGATSNEQNKHVPFDDRLETIARSNRGSDPRVKKVVRVDLGKHGPREGALFACQLRILRSKERDSTSLRGVN